MTIVLLQIVSHLEIRDFVSRVHLLSGEVRSVTTALKVVERSAGGSAGD